MVGEYPQKNTSFLFTCKENYFLGIWPADNDSLGKPGYKALIQIARAHFDAGLYDSFLAYFKESRYLIQLWAAHLILEYGKPANEIKEQCLEIISLYISNPAIPEIASIQMEWLEKYKSKEGR